MTHPARRRVVVGSGLVFVVGIALLLGVAGVATAHDGGTTSLDSSTQSEALVVDEDGGDYESIQAAIDAAEDGDAIRVRPGEYGGFRVEQDLRITGVDVLVTGPVQILGDAAPVIESMTIRPEPVPEAGRTPFGVAAAETSGDWVLRDVTVRTVPGESRPVFTRNSTGDWRIENAVLDDYVEARNTGGDWTIRNTSITSFVAAEESRGDWHIERTIIDRADQYPALDASETTGAWRVDRSALLANTSRYGSIAVEASVSSGPWTIRGSYVPGGITAASSTGDWRLATSYVGPEEASAESPMPSVQVGNTAGAWRIVESTIHGALGANTDVRSFGGEEVDTEYAGRGEATRIYWGHPGGPWDNTDEDSYGTFAEQCPGGVVFPEEVTCTNPLDSPPPEVPDASIIADIGPQASLVVDEDGGGQFEAIQSAVDAAPPGATVRVRAGEYDGFRVGKSVQIVTAGAAIDGTVRIAGDAAPVIEGFTIRNGRVNARETSGDWVLRDVTANSTAPDELGAGDATKVDALDSTGDWRVVDSEVAQIQAQRTEGDWTVANSTVASDLKAVESTGSWVVRASIIGPLGGEDTIRLTAWESSGDWLVQDSAIVGTDTSAIAADRSTGAWQVRGSYLSGELFALETEGPWTVHNSYVRGSGSGAGRDRQSVSAGQSSGEWQVTESTILGSVVAFRTDERADATGNYWGQPGGPRDDQCRGTVDCGAALGRPPATIPPFLDQLDSTTANRAPTAVVSVPSGLQDGRTAVTRGTELTFGGSQSVDPDGEIQSYEWAVDGQPASTGPQFTRIFDVPGTYPVTLTVDDGQTTDSREIAVVVTQSVGNESNGEVPDNLPPVAALDAPETTVQTGESITLSAAESEDLDGDPFAEFRWDLDGDGRVERTTAGSATTVGYDDPGEREVSVVAVDSVGGTGSATATVDVARSGSIPKARLSAEPNEDGEFVAGPPVTFDASGSTAPEGRIVAYEWDFGDGRTRRVDGEAARNRIDPDGDGPAVPPRTRHGYDLPGQYTVTVTVIDSEGRRATASTQIQVEGSDRVQIGRVRSSIPGPMVDGVGIENEYAVTVNGPSEIESVVFAFPDGETREAFRGRRFSSRKSWYVPNVEVDALTTPGTNIVEVRATDARGRTGVETFGIDVFDPPGWFEFAMGPEPTLTRNDDGQYVLQSDEPRVPPGELIGPTFEFDVPVEEISGTYTLGVGANYGFEYVFEDRLGTARGGGAISLTAPLDGLDLEADIGTDFGGSRSRSFSLDLSGTAQVTENGRRAVFERGRVAFGTDVSATTPLAGVAVYIPAADTTVGVASVDLTLTEGFEPAVGLTVNDARTALVPSDIELTNTIDLQVTAGVGSSVDLGVTRAGVEARGIAGAGAQFTTEVYPQLGVEQITVGLRAGVRACLGPCGTEWLLNDEYPLLPKEDDEQTAQIAIRP